VVVSADIKDYTVVGADITNTTIDDIKRKEFNFQINILEPDLVSNATGLPTRAVKLWNNNDTRLYTISGVYATTDVDNYNFTLYKSVNYTNVTAAACVYLHNISVVDNVEGQFSVNTTSLDNATVEAGKWLIFQDQEDINVTYINLIIKGNFS
jgi:hypothetical protein